MSPVNEEFLAFVLRARGHMVALQLLAPCKNRCEALGAMVTCILFDR